MTVRALRDSPLVIVGASDQALVVLDVLGRLDLLGHVEAVVDSSIEGPLVGSRVNGHEIRYTLGDVTQGRFPTAVVLPAIGSPDIRAAILRHVDTVGLDAGTLIDPTAVVSPTVSVQRGSLVGPHAFIGPDTHIGSGTIVNTGAVVEHHGRVGDYCHIGPGAVLAGHVSLGNGATVGAGASIRDEVTVGAAAVVGLGAAVVRDVPDGVTVVGVPATPV